MRIAKIPLVILLLVAVGLYVNNGCVAGEMSMPSQQEHHEMRLQASTPPNFMVAFLGDQGDSEGARAVLRMIKNEGADMVLHQGDFDYEDDPERWDQMINDLLGSNFPYFASIGNHDDDAWPGYQQKLQARLARIPDATCEGDLGIKSACRYKGLFFVLSGVGVMGSKHDEYIEKQLSDNHAIWRICSWHENQRLMQVDDKKDTVGWGPYEACRKGGAIIATAHSHTYSRTHLMDNFATQSIASTATTLRLEKGKTFVFVSGLGGKSIRDQEEALAKNPWWASIYTSNQGANYGALFCLFNESGVENRARCYFKDISGKVPDAFVLVSNVKQNLTSQNTSTSPGRVLSWSLPKTSNKR